MDWKGHYYDNGYTTQRDLQVQYDMDQNVIRFVYFLRQGSQEAQTSLEFTMKVSPNFWLSCLYLLSVGTISVQQMKTGFSVIYLIEL